MAFSSWRDLMGMTNPTMRSGMTEEVIRLLPEGVGIIPLFLKITHGTREVFKTVMVAHETEIERLVPQEPDLIHPNAAPPHLVQGGGSKQLSRALSREQRMSRKRYTLQRLSACCARPKSGKEGGQERAARRPNAGGR